jgi:hypothetical protein
MDRVLPWQWPDASMMPEWAWVGVLLVLVVVCLVIAVLSWILSSIGFMKMARRDHFPDPWLAWIPFASLYLFVRLAGQRVRRLGIAWMFISYFGAVLVVIAAYAGIFTFMPVYSYSYGDSMMMLPFFILLELLIYAWLITMVVMRYILLYRIFKRFKPGAATVFLVLSAVFFWLPLLESIFVLAAGVSTDEVGSDVPAPEELPPAS